MSKILFVYPNKEAYPIIPLGISLLIGILKENKHKVDLFDITFMMNKRLDHEARTSTKTVEDVDVTKWWGNGSEDNIEELFRKRINEMKPDIIAFSVIENNYGFAKKMIEITKEETNALIIVGGMFPTLAPQYFIDDKSIDIVCLGEGEYSFLELANRMDEGKNIEGIPNLLYRKNNFSSDKLTYNKYYDWNPNILPDWDIFDQRHLMKPFMGKMWRMGCFELTRGCPNFCGYCSNSSLQKRFACLGKYRREKPFDVAFQEMSYMKEKHSLELIFFNDENFAMMSKNRFEIFCARYKKEIGLPFFMATKAETICNEERVKKLKDAGCVTIGIGVEVGNEKIRKEILNKNVSNEVYEKAFDNCFKNGVRTTAYIIIGIPFETEENIFESIEFCKKIKAQSIALSIFAPYHGSEMRNLCLENGFIEDKYYEDISINSKSLLKQPYIKRERLEELHLKFNDFIFGENNE